MSLSRDSKAEKIEEIKQPLVEFWQWNLTEKMQFSCFPVLSGSAEAQVI